MSARTEQMLDYQIEHTTAAVTDWENTVGNLQAELKKAEAELEEQQAHLETLRGLRALTAGRFTLVPPGAVQSDDDVMGLAVGPFRMAPPSASSVADLQLFAATMRAIYQQAMHQAELANQEVRRRESTSTLETAVIPDDIVAQAKASTIVPPAQFVQDVMTCGIGACGLPIRYDEALSEWVHRETGDALCWPSQLEGPFADPAPDDGTTTWKAPAYPAEAAVPALPKRRPGEAIAEAPAPREMDGTVARPGTLRRVLDGVKRIGTDDKPAERVIDPDCRDGKCGSCIGGPCEHECHTQQDGDDQP